VHCIFPKDLASARPIPSRPTAETADNLVTTARGPSMNKSVDEASWGMIELLQKAKGLTRLDAYALASITMDCRIGEMTAPDKSVHCLVPKSLWVQR
jgi:acetamidase/formamidase